MYWVPIRVPDIEGKRSWLFRSFFTLCAVLLEVLQYKCGSVYIYIHTYIIEAMSAITKQSKQEGRVLLPSHVVPIRYVGVLPIHGTNGITTTIYFSIVS